MTKLFIACSSLSTCWHRGQGPRDDVIRHSRTDHCDRHHVNPGCHHHKLICKGSGQSWSQMPFSRAARSPRSPEIQEGSARASIRCRRRGWRPTKPVPGHNGKRASFAVVSLHFSFSEAAIGPGQEPLACEQCLVAVAVSPAGDPSEPDHRVSPRTRPTRQFAYPALHVGSMYGCCELSWG